MGHVVFGGRSSGRGQISYTVSGLVWPGASDAMLTERDVSLVQDFKSRAYQHQTPLLLLLLLLLHVASSCSLV